MFTSHNSDSTVSIIVPVYNAQQFLDKTIACVTEQTFANLDIIFVDDDSTDESLAILEEAAARDSRIRVISIPNGGPGAARNAGLAIAIGDFVVCVDADDFFEPTFIENLVRPFDLDPDIEITICGIDEYLESSGTLRAADWAVDRKGIPPGVPFDPKTIPFIYSYICGYAANKMVRRSTIEAFDLKWQEIRMHEDMAFVQSALAVARKAYFVDEALYHHRLRGDGGSISDLHQDTRFECLFEALEAIKQNLERTGVWSAFEEAFANYALSQCRWKYGRVSATARENVGLSLGSVWFERLGLTQYPSSFFQSSEDYQFMASLLSQYAPSSSEAHREPLPKTAQTPNAQNRSPVALENRTRSLFSRIVKRLQRL